MSVREARLTRAPSKSNTERVAELLVELGVDPGDDPLQAASAYLDGETAPDERSQYDACAGDTVMSATGVTGSAIDDAMSRVIRLAFEWKFHRSATITELSDESLVRRTCREFLDQQVTLPNGARRTLGRMTLSEHTQLLDAENRRA